MANRKSPQTEFVPDSSVADDTILSINTLGPGDFDRYVKICFNGSAEPVQQLMGAAAVHLKRIGVKPNPSKAVAKFNPDASDAFNLQNLYRWMEKLTKRHRKAVAQLVALHATASRRLGV